MEGACWQGWLELQNWGLAFQKVGKSGLPVRAEWSECSLTCWLTVAITIGELYVGLSVGVVGVQWSRSLGWFLTHADVVIETYTSRVGIGQNPELSVSSAIWVERVGLGGGGELTFRKSPFLNTAQPLFNCMGRMSKLWSYTRHCVLWGYGFSDAICVPLHESITWHVYFCSLSCFELGSSVVEEQGHPKGISSKTKGKRSGGLRCPQLVTGQVKL